MKKTFLLLAALCCAAMSWADCVGYGLELPSGTGVNERTIVNIKYDPLMKRLSFTDTYENSFTAYERDYNIYFYDYDPSYQIYEGGSGGYHPVYYGTGCGGTDHMILTSNPSDLPWVHFWAIERRYDSNGGDVVVDLSSVVNTLISQGHDHVLVGIAPKYKISATATLVNYSTYGDWNFWMMNVAHFCLKSLVSRFDSFVSLVVTPTDSIDPTAYGSPFEDWDHVYLCEGEDEATLSVAFFPQKVPSTNVTGIWQTRKDDETEWTETFSPTSHSWRVFNNAVMNGVPMFARQTFKFNASNTPEESRYFRFGLIWEGDTLFSDDIQVDVRYRIRVTGPVFSKCSNDPYSAWQGRVDEGENSLSFATITYVVEKQDTIFLKPINSGAGACDVVIAGGLAKDPESEMVYATNWTRSELKEVTVNDFSIQLYVDGELYKSFDHVLCNYSPVQCGYTAVAPSDPLFTGKWKDRATGDIWLNDPWLLRAFDDKIYDAVIAKEYPVEVAGRQVTDLNKDDVLSDGGSVKYDPDSLKLEITTGVDIVAKSGDGIAFLGDGLDHPTFILDFTPKGFGNIQAPLNGIFVDLANLTIRNGLYMVSVIGGKDAILLNDGSLTLENTKIIALSETSSALYMEDAPLTVINSHFYMSAEKAQVCVGVSDLAMSKCEFHTPDVEFSAAKKTIVDSTTGQPKSGLVKIIPSDDPEGFVNVNANVNVIKRIVNGQLVILKNGQIYSVMGEKIQ